MLHFAPQCCDAGEYLVTGQLCAQTGNCWDPEKDAGLGSYLYYSIPYRLGFPPETAILMHYLFMGLSIYLTTEILRLSSKDKGRGPKSLLMPLGVAIAHLIFMDGAAWTSLIDVPSACLALISLWLLMLGILDGAVWKQSLAGAGLGISVFVRTAYILPVFLTAVWFLSLGIWKKISSKKAMWGFSILLPIPIVMQLASTHYHVGRWALQDTPKYWDRHLYSMSAADAGFDAMWEVDRFMPYPYDASDCLKNPRDIQPPLIRAGRGPLLASLKDGDYLGIACVFLRRQGFLWGSYAHPSYLLSPSDRVFSPLIVFAHMLLLIFMIRFIIHSPFKNLFTLPVVFAAVVWGQSSLQTPENRYLMLPYVMIWSMGSAGAICWLADRRPFGNRPHP